jgi:hypothetical protein
MNILFSSLSGNGKTESYHYLRVLQRLGHQVLRFSIPASIDDLDRDFRAEPGFSPESRQETFVRLAGFTPDLFLYIEPYGLIPRGLEHAPFPTACILCDTHLYLEGRYRLARFFDHVFLYHRNYLQCFDEHPRSHVHWLPYACDLELFHPQERERDLDVAFIGQLHPRTNRAAMIARLGKSYTMNEQRFYFQKEIPSVYSRAKIVLNMPLEDDLNFRTFEAMSCGAMLLTRRVNNGQELLFEEGKHYAAFAEEKELFDKVAYYLAHAEEREKIAAAGLAEIQQCHRLEQRVVELLSTVQNEPEQAAPIRRMSPAQVDRQYAWLYEYWRMVEPGLGLASEARHAGRPWLPLLIPAIRSVLRRVKS